MESSYVQSERLRREDQMEEGEEEVRCKGPDKGSMLRVEHIR